MSLLVTGTRSLCNEEETEQDSASSAIEPQPVIHQKECFCLQVVELALCEP